MPDLEPAIRDVVLFESTQHIGHSDLGAHPPIRARVRICGDLYIERLPTDLNQKILSACMYRGYNWDLVSGAVPALYSFVRDVPNSGDAAHTGRWDDAAGRPLQAAVAISRICHPTSIALEYAARVYAPGIRHQTDYVVEPALVAGHGNQAFVADDTQRNWLTAGDVADLGAMIQTAASMPSRVKRAMWMYEYAARTADWPVRFPLTVTGIEALTNTEQFRSTKQFCVGVTGLAQDVGEVFTNGDALKAYEYRSKYVHGQQRTHTGVDILIATESILRKALRKALTDQTYASVFATEASIRARFPLI